MATIAAVAAGSGIARATPLTFVTVRAPLRCSLNIPCMEIGAIDTDVTINVSSPVWSGIARLQTRTFRASFPPTGPKNFYEYRVDLTQAVTNADAACITDLAIDFGPVIKLQYNGAGPLDHGYVVDRGRASTIGLLAVDQTNGVITFTFNEPICAGAAPGTGRASRSFGMASPFPPRAIVARVSVPGLDPIPAQARAPQHRQ